MVVELKRDVRIFRGIRGDRFDRHGIHRGLSLDALLHSFIGGLFLSLIADQGGDRNHLVVKQREGEGIEFGCTRRIEQGRSEH